MNMFVSFFAVRSKSITIFCGNVKQNADLSDRFETENVDKQK